VPHGEPLVLLPADGELTMLKLVLPKGSLEEQTLRLMEAADLHVRRGSSRDYHGKQDVAQFFDELGQAQEAELFEPQEVIAEGDKVMVMGQAKWTVRANGNHYEYPWAHAFTIRDGKISRFQQYYDTAATEAAFMPTETASIGADTGATPSLH